MVAVRALGMALAALLVAAPMPSGALIATGSVDLARAPQPFAFAGDLVAEGSIVYALFDFPGASGFAVLDASTPSEPVEIGRVDGWTVFAPSLAVRDGVALVATGLEAEGVIVLDVSTPSAPLELTRIVLPGRAREVALVIDGGASNGVLWRRQDTSLTGRPTARGSQSHNVGRSE